MLSQIIKSVIKRNEPATISDPFGYSSMKGRVWPHVIDYNLHMNNAKYLTVLEKARWAHFRELGWFKKMLDSRINIVIGSLELTFIRELGFLQAYDIQTHILTWDEKYLYFEQKIFVKGKLHGHALFKFAGIRKGKRVMMPEMCDALGVDYAAAPRCPEIDHWNAMSQTKRESDSS